MHEVYDHERLTLTLVDLMRLVQDCLVGFSLGHDRDHGSRWLSGPR